MSKKLTATYTVDFIRHEDMFDAFQAKFGVAGEKTDTRWTFFYEGRSSSKAKFVF